MCGCGLKGNSMLPLYKDAGFTFRFADDRIIPRFHLEGVEAGRRVEVFKIDPSTGERLGLLATAAARQRRVSITTWSNRLSRRRWNACCPTSPERKNEGAIFASAGHERDDEGRGQLRL